MTLTDIFLIIYPAAIVNDDTMIYIHQGANIVARGHWMVDNILRYSDHEVLQFSLNNQTNTLSVKVRCID